MATVGDLKDISLTSLVQMLCLERRNVTLALKRPGEDGFIFFEQGEIFHARCGSLSGEEAVYRLLGWEHGTFMLSEQANLHTRSIRMPTQHLLLEAMNRMDEAGAVTCEKPLSLAEIEQDNQLENSLIQLLSRLEQLQSQGNNPKRPTQLLQALVEMLNQAIAFIDKQPKLLEERFFLSDALAMAARLHPAVHLLQISENRLSFQNLMNFYNNWSGNIDGRDQAFHQIAQGIIYLLQSCFEQLGKAFYSPAAAKQWQDTWQIFLADLSQLIEKFRF